MIQGRGFESAPAGRSLEVEASERSEVFPFKAQEAFDSFDGAVTHGFSDFSPPDPGYGALPSPYTGTQTSVYLTERESERLAELARSRAAPRRRSSARRSLRTFRPAEARATSRLPRAFGVSIAIRARSLRSRRRAARRFRSVTLVIDPGRWSRSRPLGPAPARDPRAWCVASGAACSTHARRRRDRASRSALRPAARRRPRRPASSAVQEPGVRRQGLRGRGRLDRRYAA